LTTDLIARAQTGDDDAFRELTQPYRRELQVHCYRMLGSLQDAEDALQDTLLAAWQGLRRFEGRASIRTWLYRIATNRCLNALRSASRRPAKGWDIPQVEPPEPSRLGEVVWLEPYPDALLEGAIKVPLGPEARYQQTEAISLAFVTALQVLPARQRAVLILRDVLGYHASEVAGMLDATVESVNSVLKRARAGLRRRVPTGDREPPAAPDSRTERALLAKFVRAWESGDVDALVALLTADSARIPRPRRRSPVLRQSPAPSIARPRADASEWPAGVRRLPSRPYRRHPPRHRPLRPHAHRRSDLGHDPVRQQRAPLVRAAANAP
jgi:RNA polymerase sigma-70 factor (TIGR02960 family)